MESSDEELELVFLLALRRRQRKKKRSMWVRPIFKLRRQQGEYHNLLQEMRLSDPDSHFRYLRMSKQRFDNLLAMVGPLISHRHYSSTVRAEIHPAERLALTLRFLCTGNSQVSLSFNFRMGRSTVCGIVRETCDAIWSALQPQYVKAPSCEAEWVGVSKQFEQIWNFPNCLGAIDGKHIVMQAPRNSGSSFFNYKGTHSVVLLAVCDAHYRFILVDLGDAGRHSDGGVLSNSEFGKALEAGSLSFPAPRPLPGTTQPDLPYIIVGDEAFPLKPYMMRPYPGRNLPENQAVFNYRLSRARRIIENSFGIMAARWRLFRRPIIADPDRVVSYSQAAIALHNYLRTTESSVYCPAGFVDGEDGAGNTIEGGWRSDEDMCSGLEPLRQSGSNMYSRSAASVREQFRDYFDSRNGEVSWQYNHVRRT